jgi:hypothetical protein
VRGLPEKDHRVYELFQHHWNLVDRVNEDYHNFFQLHGSKSACAFAIESIAFHMAMNARAIWEETRRSHQYNVSRGQLSAAESEKKCSIARFIYKVAKRVNPFPEKLDHSK